MHKTQVLSVGWEDPLHKGMATSPVLLPGKSMGRRAWWATAHGVAESDMTERLSTHACMRLVSWFARSMSDKVSIGGYQSTEASWT